MPRLTKKMVDEFQFPEGATTSTGKPLSQAFLWCTDPVGFGVRITRTGKRTYFVQGRVKGEEVRVPVGRYGVESVEQARTNAKEVLRGLRLGVDPRVVAKEEAASKVTLRQVADAYLRDRPLKDSSKAEIERHVTTTFEAWLKKPIVSINREAVTKRYNEIKTKGLRGDGPAPAQANQSCSILRALFNYAIREYRKPDGSPVLTDNPVDVLYKKWTPLKPRTSRIPDAKVGAVLNMLLTARTETFNRDALAGIDFVILVLLTGARKSEMAELTWDRVNLEEGWFHLPDPKNSNPIWIPLSTQAREILKTRERVKGSPFVFTSWGKSGHIKDPRDRLKKISEAAGTPISLHDLRRTYTTIGVANCKIDLQKIESLTGHRPIGVTARHYLETQHLQYLMPETQLISDWIYEQARIASAVAAGENVVPLRA